MTEHPIRLRNSASEDRKPQRLVPLDWQDESVAPADRRVRMYVCGPTVYDRAHIGNARPVVVFDVLYRLLRHVYGENAVTYVRNITDVDDKINKRAADTRAAGESTLDGVRRITDETTRWYHEDMAALGALPPTHEPRATDFVADPARETDMIRMIEALIEKGCAYEAEGHVLFEVAKWPDYGRLSRRPLDEMEAGARVEVAPYKRNPLDFVLWKPSDETLPGWESPWGRGRPGWHIECSAMSRALLGERFDIHGGGIDLQFPHHENELAQSCCANGTDAMAQVWMHNGYLMVEGEKMSKSLGNIITPRQLLSGLYLEDKNVWYVPMQGVEIRLALLLTHYSHPLDWTAQRINQARKALSRWKKAAAPHHHMSTGAPDDTVIAAVTEDLNTPDAINAIHTLCERAEQGDREAGESLVGTLEFFDFYDSYVEESPTLYSIEKGFFDEAFPGAVERIDHLVSTRSLARQRKDFTRADAVRGFLHAAGVAVEDKLDGSAWHFANENVELGWLRLVQPAMDGRIAHSVAELIQLAEARGVAIEVSSDEPFVSLRGSPPRTLDFELVEAAEKEAA